MTPAEPGGAPPRPDATPTAETLVVLGGSAGGLKAVRHLAGRLHERVPFATAIALHRSDSSGGLAEMLGPGVREAYDKDPLLPGRVYLAPAGYHLLVDGDVLSLSVDDPVRHSRPSIDVLFETAADAFGSRTTGVVLTGGNADGARGLARIAAAGGRALVQDPATAESATMPRAALNAVPDALVLDLDAIATTLVGDRNPDVIDP